MNKENIILTSDDDSITLTNIRVIQRNKEMNKEILLKDIVSNEIIRKKSKYYLALIIIFTLLSTFSLYKILESENLDQLQILYFILFLLIYSVFLYLTKIDKCLKISGKYNSIEFSIKNLSESSLNKFRNTLLIESENTKTE